MLRIVESNKILGSWAIPSFGTPTHEINDAFF